MKESIIEEIMNYSENLPTLLKPKDEEYRHIVLEKSSLTKELLDSFSDEQKRLFEKYSDLANTAGSLEVDEAYKQGFSLGVKITSKAFVSDVTSK